MNMGLVAVMNNAHYSSLRQDRIVTDILHYLQNYD